VEDELLNVLYKWLPSNVPMFERMQTMRKVSASSAAAGRVDLGIYLCARTRALFRPSSSPPSYPSSIVLLIVLTTCAVRCRDRLKSTKRARSTT